MINTLQPFPVICVYDEVLKKVPETAILEYARGRDYQKISRHLPGGAKPVIYHVVRLPRSIMLGVIMPLTTDESRFLQCFRHGVQRIENASTDAGGTMVIEPTGDAWTMEELERVDPCDVYEIGSVIWYKSFLRRNSANCYVVPRTSREILENLTYQSALANQIEQLQNNSNQTSTEAEHGSTTTATMQENDASKSVPHGDVPARERDK